MTPPNTDTAPILILGASGKTGRRVAARLRQQGIAIREARRPAFDWQQPETWPAMLHGARAAYIAFAPDLAAPGAIDTMADFARQAALAGLQHLVLLSGRGEPEAEACEQLVQRAGPAWTILRASWFMQNFSEEFLRDAIRQGAVPLPLDGVREPFIDAEDIAEVAVAALLDPARHASQLYELTGPALLSFPGAVAAIGTMLQRDIAYIKVPMEEYFQAMAAQGIPADYAALVRYLFTTVLDGRNENLADGVQRALGRPPRDFTAFGTAAAEAGAWKA
ncbi:NmrA family transcriptional regulator [Ferrovibrio sp.]|uniref:NmrA family NAD(P)-binding protein n=1 Tax=Ferrovibrio sp. TaxID=1917215 RepID=UPI003D099FF2